MDRRTVVSLALGALLPNAGAIDAREAGTQSPKRNPVDTTWLPSGWVSPTQFFKGNWSSPEADHTEAMQAALDSGSSVSLPSGDIKISRELRVRKCSGIVVRGAGRGATRIVQYTIGMGVLLIWGTRLRFEDFEIGWATPQLPIHNSSFGLKAWERGDGAILATTLFRNIQIRGAGIAIDLRNSIGYSNSYEDIGISSFAVAALSCDDRTAHTQSRFDAWHVSNQPFPYRSGRSAGGSTSTVRIVEPLDTENSYVGSAIVFTSGEDDTSRGVVQWIIGYDAVSGLLTFYPPLKHPVKAGTHFEISYLGQATKECIAFRGFTDLRIGMLAIEFHRLSSTVPAPILFENCNVVSIDLLRFERISFGASSSALVSAAGRCTVRIGAMQTQYIAALRRLGCLHVFIGRVFNEARISVDAIECDRWNATASTSWAHSTGLNRGEGTSGIDFRQQITGDQSFVPNGQAYDRLGKARQTAIVGRPPRESRGASLDEGAPVSYIHNLMRSPDVVRFNSSLPNNIYFDLDIINQVSGAEVVVVRGPHAGGNGIITIRAGLDILMLMRHQNESVRLICNGEGYAAVRSTSECTDELGLMVR